MNELSHARIQRGGDRRSSTPTRKNHKNIGFLSNTGPDPLNNHKATKPAFNVGPSLARQRKAIEMAFFWGANVSPLLVVFGSPHLKKTQKNVKVGPPLKKLSGSACFSYKVE